jgi:hypothetical protein
MKKIDNLVLKCTTMDTTRTKSRIVEEMTETLKDLKKAGAINEEQLANFVKLESLGVNAEKGDGN